MRAGTAARLLIVVMGSVLLILAVLSLAGNEEARSTLRPMIVLVGLLGGLGYLSYRFKIAPRRELFSDEATRLGLRAEPGDPTGFLGSGFEVVRRQASVRDVETTAMGTWREWDVSVVDYWYAPSSDSFAG